MKITIKELKSIIKDVIKENSVNFRPVLTGSEVLKKFCDDYRKQLGASYIDATGDTDSHIWADLSVGEEISWEIVTPDGRTVAGSREIDLICADKELYKKIEDTFNVHKWTIE